MEQVSEPLSFDPDEVRERYRLERDERLRDNGTDQYIEMAGDYARFADPYVEPGFTRDPIADDIAIVGGGFSGLWPPPDSASGASPGCGSSRPQASGGEAGSLDLGGDSKSAILPRSWRRRRSRNPLAILHDIH